MGDVTHGGDRQRYRLPWDQPSGAHHIGATDEWRVLQVQRPHRRGVGLDGDRPGPGMPDSRRRLPVLGDHHGRPTHGPAYHRTSGQQSAGHQPEGLLAHPSRPQGGPPPSGHLHRSSHRAPHQRLVQLGEPGPGPVGGEGGVMDHVEPDEMVELPRRVQRPPLPAVVVPLHARDAPAFRPQRDTGEVDTVEVDPLPQRVVGQVAAQRCQVVVPGDDPDLMVAGGGEHHAEPDLRFRSLARLAGVGRDEDLHRMSRPCIDLTSWATTASTVIPMPNSRSGPPIPPGRRP